MRWFYTAVVVVFVAAILIFAAQNFEPITVRFLSLSLQLPTALFTVGIYVIGMVTGSSLLGMLRSSYKKSRSEKLH